MPFTDTRRKPFAVIFYLCIHLRLSMWSIILLLVCAVITAQGKLYLYSASWTLLFVTSMLSHLHGRNRPDLAIYIADRIAITTVIGAGGYYYREAFRRMNVWQKLVPVFAVIAVAAVHFGTHMKWPEKFVVIHLLTVIGHLPIIHANSRGLD